MCTLLSLFMVVGAFQVAPDAMMVQIMNNDRIEMFIVPIDQYKRCDIEEKAVKIWQKFLNPIRKGVGTGFHPYGPSKPAIRQSI